MSQSQFSVHNCSRLIVSPFYQLASRAIAVLGEMPGIVYFAVIKVGQGVKFIALSARELLLGEGQLSVINDETVVKEGVVNEGRRLAFEVQEAGILSKVDDVFEGFRSSEVHDMSSIVVGKAVGDVEKEVMKRNCGAHFMTLAPDSTEYSTITAKGIASGSRILIKWILLCGDLTVYQLEWWSAVLRERIDSVEKKEIGMKRIERAKSVTKGTKKVTKQVLSGVVRVSGFFMSSVANSKAGKKLFSMLPGDMILASLDGFDKIWDAVEVAGKEVMSKTSCITVELITHRYGEDAGKATHGGLDAAGHALGTAWTVLNIRKALNPKHVLKPSRFVKSVVRAGAAGYKAQKPKQ